jgi:predicted ATP-dependent serine protease
VTDWDDVKELETTPCVAPLVDCLGGVQVGALIVVSGVPGEGKSTECARVAVALHEPPAYLDHEMPAARCRKVLRDAGASERFVRETRRIDADHWEDALVAARGSRVVILDSVQAWCPQEEEEDLASELVALAEGGALVLAIAQWTRKGRARGSLTVEHRGDVTIDVHPEHFAVRKARWGMRGDYPRPRLTPGQVGPRAAAARVKR